MQEIQTGSIEDKKVIDGKFYKELQLLDKRIEGLIYDINNDFDKEAIIGRLKAMRGQSGRLLDNLK